MKLFILRKATLNPSFQNLLRFFKVGIITALLAFLGAVIAGLSFKFLGIESDNQTKNFYTDNFTPATIFIVVNLIAPVLEELAYRLHLRFSPLNFAVSFGLLSYFLLSSLMGESSFFPDESLLYRVPAGLLFGGLLYWLSNRNAIRKKLSSFWEVYNKPLFIASALIFAFGHLQNHALDAVPVYLYPIMVLPQLVYGFSYGYLRLKMGIFWSITLHCLINMMF